MDFYIEMMPQVIYGDKPIMFDKCSSLCEKKFEKGELLREIQPCGHIFHEKCIKVWVFKDQNQFCPQCRGNIMKKIPSVQNIDL